MYSGRTRSAGQESGAPMAKRAKTKTKAKPAVAPARARANATAVSKKAAAVATVATKAPPIGKAKANTAMGPAKTATATPSTTGTGDIKRSARLSNKATKEKVATGAPVLDSAKFHAFSTGQAAQLMSSLLSTSKETPRLAEEERLASEAVAAKATEELRLSPGAATTVEAAAAEPTERDSAGESIPGGTAVGSEQPVKDGSVLSEHEIKLLSGLATPSDRPPMTQILSGYPITTDGWDVPIDTLLEASSAQKRSVSLTAKFLDFMKESRSKCKAQMGTMPATWEVIRDFLLEAGQTGGRITRNVQCKRPLNECNNQKCCPREYAHGTMVTYHAKLKAAGELQEYPSLFEGDHWASWLKKFGKRQQKNNRHPMPAPALLLNVAEDLAAETLGWIAAALDENLPEIFCPLAQFFVLFCFDVHSGRRTIDISKIQAANTHIVGQGSPQERWLIGIVDNKCNIPPATLTFQKVDSPTCPITAANLYLDCMKEANLEIGGPTGSPFLFPRIFFPQAHGRFPEIGPHRQTKRPGESGLHNVGKWEHAQTADANVWLSKVIRRCDDGGARINIDFTIHGTRGAAAMVSLASQRKLSSINAQQGWTSDSEQAKAYGRLLQLEQISTPAVLDVDQIKSFLQQDLVKFHNLA